MAALDRLAREIIDDLQNDGTIDADLSYEERRLLEQQVERIIDSRLAELLDDGGQQ